MEGTKLTNLKSGLVQIERFNDRQRIMFIENPDLYRFLINVCQDQYKRKDTIRYKDEIIYRHYIKEAEVKLWRVLRLIENIPNIVNLRDEGIKQRDLLGMYFSEAILPILSEINPLVLAFICSNREEQMENVLQKEA